MVQGIGFALVASIVRAWEEAQLKIWGLPTRCRACGEVLICVTKPDTFHVEPYYICPSASPAFGARIIRGFPVVECDF